MQAWSALIHINQDASIPFQSAAPGSIAPKKLRKTNDESIENQISKNTHFISFNVSFSTIVLSWIYDNHYLQHSDAMNQQNAFHSIKKREDFIDLDSENVAFKISNIVCDLLWIDCKRRFIIEVMFGEDKRAKITKKYVMKSHFEFLFTDYYARQQFVVKTVSSAHEFKVISDNFRSIPCFRKVPTFFNIRHRWSRCLLRQV